MKSVYVIAWFVLLICIFFFAVAVIGINCYKSTRPPGTCGALDTPSYYVMWIGIGIAVVGFIVSIFLLIATKRLVAQPTKENYLAEDLASNVSVGLSVIIMLVSGFFIALSSIGIQCYNANALSIKAGSATPQFIVMCTGLALAILLFILSCALIGVVAKNKKDKIAQFFSPVTRIFSPKRNDTGEKPCRIKKIQDTLDEQPLDKTDGERCAVYKSLLITGLDPQLNKGCETEASQLRDKIVQHQYAPSTPSTATIPKPTRPLPSIPTTVEPAQTPAALPASTETTTTTPVAAQFNAQIFDRKKIEQIMNAGQKT